MVRLSDLGVAKRLGLIVAVGMLSLGTVAGIGAVSQDKLSHQSELVSTLEAATAALNHLDTRAVELKVGGYLALGGSDIGQLVDEEVPGDIDSLNKAVAAFEELELPADLEAKFEEVRRNVEPMNRFMTAFVAAAQRDPASMQGRMDDIHAQNDLIDTPLDALKEELGPRTEQAQSELHDMVAFMRTLSIVVALAAAALLVGLSVPLVRSITRPIERVGRVVTALASGDLTVRSEVSSADEFGRMAAGLDGAIEALSASMRQISGSAATLAGASAELTTVASGIAGAVNDTSTRTRAASAQSEEVSRHVQTVAAGSEEMGQSIREIAQSTSEAARIAGSAVSEAERATRTIAALGESSAQIGQVLKLITSIAEQTNLLALNATIEAARAGEMGKGFAVVAGEVKELAQETAKATDDISTRVAAIQRDTEGAVEVIDKISNVIAKINEYQTTIASAVEEQTATTQEMSRGITDAATGSDRIAHDISEVASAGDRSLQGALQAEQASGEVARTADELRELVGRFRLG
ncbi:methyl-accepting chemotaxis protein [Planomonospora sp. ID82291]|uniref:methyl-accepting chemotaxis protein n=1 Tax=Planomonospora sp. ID82291 TaxID=2738136 RepID=UPI0018C394A3|nr:methyl-accepting chemotaxis protein [Planomonospora sp. ID82291]MBG0816470.1 methyl-accepting chemotaxis protein [Planomonospora sp. ID82291]